MEGLGLLLALLAAAEVKDPLADLNRFPPHDHAKVQYEASLASYIYWKKRANPAEETAGCFIEHRFYNIPTLSFHSPERRQIIHQYRSSSHRYNCWGYLYKATDRGYSWHMREYFLKELKSIMDEKDWAAGQMPYPWIPFDR